MIDMFVDHGFSDFCDLKFMDCIHKIQEIKCSINKNDFTILDLNI